MFGLSPALIVLILLNLFLIAVVCWLAANGFLFAKQAEVIRQEIRRELVTNNEEWQKTVEQDITELQSALRELDGKVSLIIDNNPCVILQAIDRIIFDIRSERKDGESLGDIVDLLWMALDRDAQFCEVAQRIEQVCELREAGKVNRQAFPSGAIKDLQGIVNC